MPNRIKIYLNICVSIPFFLLNLSLPSLTSAATCNMMDAIIYGYSYSTEGVIQDYGVSGSGCGVAGTGDSVCDALGSGGGGCAAVGIGPGSTYGITIGIQNEGSAPDRYQISWGTPAGWNIVMQEVLNDESIVEYPSPVNVPTTTPGNPSFYNPGEISFFTFKIATPADFTSSQELVFDVMSVEDNTRVDSVKMVVNSRDILSPAPVVLRAANITETSVTVEWTAPIGGIAFLDDFSDGMLSPWSQLKNGVVAVVDNGGNYILRKTVNNDANGGWAPLLQTIEDFELILYTRRVSTAGGMANRYTITDASGNGYGVNLNFVDEMLYIDRRDAWPPTPLGTGSAVSGGLTLDQWYTLQFTKEGQILTARAYLGPVDPATATPIAIVSVSDSTWNSFTQVNVNGGYDYDTDDIRVNDFKAATSYDLRYSTSTITTDAEFINANRVSSCEPGESDLVRPKSPGSSESCTISQVFTDTDYFFALKSSDEAGNISLISTCPTCPAHTSKPIEIDTMKPENVRDLTVETKDITKDTIKLCWTAPTGDIAFFDDFSDGMLSPWSQLKNGVVAVVDDGGNYILRKTVNNDANGGWAPLLQTIEDFELILYTRRVSTAGGMANRYTITDASGNGYGVNLNFVDEMLYIDRRDAWPPTPLGTGSAVSGGLTLDQWYTLQFTKEGQILTARVYLGRVGTATATPIAIVSASDSTWNSFTQVNVNGGYDYDTDDVLVNAFINPVTTYILRYSTKYIVDDGITPGMGETTFTNATPVQVIGLPKSPGSLECYTIQVQNILPGNDGILGTADDIDRTPNTQFFFAIKAEDENHNLSSLSNVASGLTAMSSFVYNMVSVPKVPNPNSPASVFGDDVSPSSLNLYRWDSRGIGNNQGCYDAVINDSPGQYNPFNVSPACTGISAIAEGRGYLLWSPRQNIVLDVPPGSTDACADTSLCNCTNEAGQSFICYTLPLDFGWNMFGNPFGKEVDVKKINIQSPEGITKSFQNAVIEGWVEGAIATYSGINYTDEACNSVACNVVLQPWKGYWLWVKGGAGYKMLIPRP